MLNTKFNPKAIGEITESAVTTELLKRSVSVSLPVGDNQRYDMIFEAKNRLWKAQVKTLSKSPRDEAYVFNTQSVRINSSGYKRSNYIGEVDIFLAWSMDFPLNLYAIPIEIASNGGSMRLCLVKPKKLRKHNWHEDFFFDEWLAK